jgi:hypothetical protein
MAHRLEQRGDLRQAALGLGAVAEVLADGPGDLVAVAAAQGRQPGQAVAAGGQAGEGLGREGATLGIELLLQLAGIGQRRGGGGFASRARRSRRVARLSAAKARPIECASRDRSFTSP